MIFHWISKPWLVSSSTLPPKLIDSYDVCHFVFVFFFPVTNKIIIFWALSIVPPASLSFYDHLERIALSGYTTIHLTSPLMVCIEVVLKILFLSTVPPKNGFVSISWCPSEIRSLGKISNKRRARSMNMSIQNLARANKTVLWKVCSKLYSHQQCKWGTTTLRNFSAWQVKMASQMTSKSQLISYFHSSFISGRCITVACCFFRHCGLSWLKILYFRTPSS